WSERVIAENPPYVRPPGKQVGSPGVHGTKLRAAVYGPASASVNGVCPGRLRLCRPGRRPAGNRARWALVTLGWDGGGRNWGEGWREPGRHGRCAGGKLGSVARTGAPTGVARARVSPPRRG